VYSGGTPKMLAEAPEVTFKRLDACLENQLDA
jgi:hypothetical protein